MLTTHERRLLLLLSLWIAVASALDALALHRPAELERWVGVERLSDLRRAGTREPDALPDEGPGSSPSSGPVSSPNSEPGVPDTLGVRQPSRDPERGRPLSYDARGRLDLNRADAMELDLLPGVGPALASRILAERKRRGAFSSPKDLLRVRGIGPKTLAKLLPRVTVRAAKDSLRAPADPPDSSLRFAR